VGSQRRGARGVGPAHDEEEDGIGGSLSREEMTQ
jgi:hypothetical protein